MGITYAKSSDFTNGLVQSIIALMKQNKIHVIDLTDTVFGEKANWICLSLDNDKLSFTKKSITGCENYTAEVKTPSVHRWDIVKLVEIALDKVEKAISEPISDEEFEDLMRDEKRFQ